jgi:hypothetical protein
MNANAVLNAQRHDWKGVEVNVEQIGETGDVIEALATGHGCPTVGTDWMDEGLPFAIVEW